MAWRRPGDKPLSGPIMVRLPTHICVTRPQRVKSLCLLFMCEQMIAQTIVSFINFESARGNPRVKV